MLVGVEWAIEWAIMGYGWAIDVRRASRDKPSQARASAIGAGRPGRASLRLLGPPEPVGAC